MQEFRETVVIADSLASPAAGVFGRAAGGMRRERSPSSAFR